MSHAIRSIELLTYKVEPNRFAGPASAMTAIYTMNKQMNVSATHAFQVIFNDERVLQVDVGHHKYTAYKHYCIAQRCTTSRDEDTPESSDNILVMFVSDQGENILPIFMSFKHETEPMMFTEGYEEEIPRLAMLPTQEDYDAIRARVLEAMETAY